MPVCAGLELPNAPAEMPPPKIRVEAKGEAGRVARKAVNTADGTQFRFVLPPEAAAAAARGRS